MEYKIRLMEFLIAGCCWWNCFQFCGCIPPREREVIRVEPVVVVVKQEDNPFKNPNAPKDPHLQPVY